MHSKRETLNTKPRFLRAKKSKGGSPKVDPRGGYRKAGLIKGVSVITAGEALGHGMWIDNAFVESTTEHINSFNKGVKARFTHPGLSSDGLGSFLGRVMNAKTVGDKTIADLHFSSAGHNTPDGDLASYVMDLARDDGDAFGLSIVFEADELAEESFLAEHTDENGQFTSPDANNQSHLPHARLSTLRAADVVDEPAANPDGLFHREQQFAQEATSIAEYALGLTTETPQLVSLGLDADRVAGFVKRFLADHGLEVQKMNEEKDPAAEPIQAQPESTPAEKPADETLSSLNKYLTAFGDIGGRWFAEGKPFEECVALHAQEQARENAALKAQVEELTNRLAGAIAGSAGESAPHDFRSGESTEKTRKGFASKIRVIESVV